MSDEPSEPGKSDESDGGSGLDVKEVPAGGPGAGRVAPDPDLWEQVVADMAATAADYEKRGWEVLELHPGDVAIVTDEDRRGFDVLLSGEEFDALQEFIEEDAGFDQYEVFRADASLVYALVAMEDPDEQVAVCFPIYYDPKQATGLFAAARESGELHASLRRLDGERIEFTYTDPGLFIPDE